MQKSLQGLDNVTAEGTEAIDSLISIVQVLADHGAERSWAKSIENKIKESKRYLKTDFKAHIEREGNCPDHCCTYSLSDPTIKEYQSKCSHDHDIDCDRCESIDCFLYEVEAKIKTIQIDEEQRNRLQFDFDQCNAAIRSWKAHLLRTVLQEEAKQDAMQRLDDETCLVVIDWAMKFLPIKYRESMTEFFGKRGLSWHVSSVITKSKEKYDVECFVHLLNSCTQNNYSVASILDGLFKTIKLEYPRISKAYLRSDNAGCYHNSPLILYLAGIGTRSGISLLRYDFSDPQAGKDICDRKTAPMKAHIRRFVNEKNDVVTAEDMKTALESHGGLKGCRVTVVELDSSQDLQDDYKIPGISLLYNFEYEKKGVRMWKAYGIGKGKLLLYKDFYDSERKIDDLKVVLPFSQRQKEPGTIQSATGEPTQLIFGCNDSTCILTFKTEREAQAHMDTGNHVRELESVSLFDNIRMKWAERVTGIHSVVSQSLVTTAVVLETGEQVAESARRTPDMGWALKVTREKRRFEEKVKTFLIDKFENGERSGNKADPSSVSKEMKVKKDGNGKLYFAPEEWKTAQQIKNFFSRYRAKLRQMQVGDPRGDKDVLDEPTEEDVEAWEAETTRQDLRDVVYVEITRPEHPIEAEHVNVCQLSKDGKLRELKLAQLKVICQTLQLKIEGSHGRKKSFVDPLEELVKSCTCHR